MIWGCKRKINESGTWTNNPHIILKVIYNVFFTQGQQLLRHTLSAWWHAVASIISRFARRVVTNSFHSSSITSINSTSRSWNKINKNSFEKISCFKLLTNRKDLVHGLTFRPRKALLGLKSHSLFLANTVL